MLSNITGQMFLEQCQGNSVLGVEAANHVGFKIVPHLKMDFRIHQSGQIWTKALSQLRVFTKKLLNQKAIFPNKVFGENFEKQNFMEDKEIVEFKHLENRLVISKNLKIIFFFYANEKQKPLSMFFIRCDILHSWWIIWKWDSEVS